jgi:hypothetical protein
MIDEYQGQGGTYLLDPKTGKRKLIEQTQPSPPPTLNEVESNAAPKSQTPDPGQNRKPVRNRRKP